jgi:hypothetical protein
MQSHHIVHHNIEWHLVVAALVLLVVFVDVRDGDLELGEVASDLASGPSDGASA